MVTNAVQEAIELLTLRRIETVEQLVQIDEALEQLGVSVKPTRKRHQSTRPVASDQSPLPVDAEPRKAKSVKSVVRQIAESAPRRWKNDDFADKISSGKYGVSVKDVRGSVRTAVWHLRQEGVLLDVEGGVIAAKHEDAVKAKDLKLLNAGFDLEIVHGEA